MVEEEKNWFSQQAKNKVILHSCSADNEKKLAWMLTKLFTMYSHWLKAFGISSPSPQSTWKSFCQREPSQYLISPQNLEVDS